jgi:hypothetical protein
VSGPEQRLSVDLDDPLADLEVVRRVNRRAAAIVDLRYEDTLVASVQRVAGLALDSALYNHSEFFVGRFLDFDFLQRWSLKY